MGLLFDRYGYVIRRTNPEVEELKVENKSLRRRNSKLEGLVTIDDRTKLPNERSLKSRLESLGRIRIKPIKEERRKNPYGRREYETTPPMGYLVQIDIDRFKLINDNEDVGGHEAGNAILEELGRIVRKDEIFRKHGEEFYAVLDKYSEEEALGYAEMIRKRIKNHKGFRYGSKTFNITVSIGIAPYPITDKDERFLRLKKKKLPKKSEPIGLLMNMADVATYEAKNRGRDCVVSWSELLKNE